MTAYPTRTLSARPWPWWRVTLTALTALGLLLSSYLSWHYLVGGSVIGCSGGSPCEQVLNSRWSTVFGILPISGLAAGAYLAMLMLNLFFISDRIAAPDRRLAWRAMLALAGAIAGSAVWFIILQKWVIGEFCPYCMATHITGLLLASLIIWRAPTQLHNPVQTFRALTPILIGLTLAATVALCQIFFAPSAPYRSGESRNTYLATIDSHTAAVLGSPDAPYVVILLFDFNCPHCQHLHAMLDEVIRRYHGKIAFAMCPAPLNNKCNPYVPGSVAAFDNSCELTKVALAVWVANPQAFPAFDRWMFSSDSSEPWHPRSLDAARSKAIDLIGQSKFDTAQSDPRIDQYLQTSVRIYGNTVNPDQSGNAVPKLVFGSRWVTPDPHNTDDLMTILHTNLAVPSP